MEVSEVFLCYGYIISYKYVEMVILVRTEFVILSLDLFIFPFSLSGPVRMKP